MMAPSWPWHNSRPPTVSLSDVTAVVIDATGENPSGLPERLLAAAELAGFVIYTGWRGRLSLAETDADELVEQRMLAKDAADAAQARREQARQAETEQILRVGGILQWIDSPRTRHLAVAEAQARMQAEDPRR